MRLTRASGRGAKKLAKALVPQLPAFLKLLGGMMRDARVSLLDRGLVVAVILYVVSPLDLIPDFLGILGLSDDLFLLALVVRRLVLGAGEEVVASHWSGTAAELRRLRDAVDELGGLLPGPVRGMLGSFGGGGEGRRGAG